MKIYVRFYPEPESVCVEIEPTDTFKTLLSKVYDATNLESSDKLKVSYNGIPIQDYEVTLQDYEVKENTNVNVIIVEMKNVEIVNNVKRFRVKLNNPRNQGVLGHLSDLALVTIFSFLDTPALVATNSVCRRWRNFTSYSENLWKYNAISYFEQDTSYKPIEVKKEEKKKDDEDDDEKKDHQVKKVNFVETLEIKLNELPYLTWIVERVVAKQDWKHATKFSNFVATPTLKEMSKSKVYILQKKPKPLTDEDEKFLAENDVQDIRKKLRTKKGMKELYKKYKQLEKAKKEYEQGNWRSIPDNWRLFDFNTLMAASFGVEHNEWFAKYENGKFTWGKQSDGQAVFTGHLNALNQQFYFAQVEVIDDEQVYKSEGEHKDISAFFELFKHLDLSQKFEIKRLLDIKQGKLEELEINKGKILANWTEWDKNTKPDTTKDCMIQDQGTFKVYGTNAKLYNHSDATIVNLENLRRTYLSVMKSAEKDSTYHIALPCLEEQILNSDGSNSVLFKDALKQESLVEEFLRAVRDIEEDHSKDKNQILSPRSKKLGLQKLVRVTLYLEDETKVQEGIQYLKDVLSGKKEEKVRNFDREELKEEKKITPVIIDEVPEWKKNLEKKKLEKKEEPKKEEPKKPAGPTWQEKLAIKKAQEEGKEKVIPEQKKEEPIDFRSVIKKSEDKKIEPEKKPVKEEPKQVDFRSALKKGTTTEVEKKPVKEEPKQVDFRNALKKGPSESVEPVEKKQVKEEPKQVDFRNALKKGTSEVVEKKPVKEEPKQVDFRNVLKKTEPKHEHKHEEKQEETKHEEKQEETKQEEQKQEEVKHEHEEPKHEEETKHEETKHEETKHEEVKHEEHQHEETKHEVKDEEPKHEHQHEHEEHHEETKHEEQKQEEVKHEETKHEEVKHEEVKHEETKHEEVKHEEPKHEEPKHEETKHEEPKHEETKHEEVKQEVKEEKSESIPVKEGEDFIKVKLEGDELEKKKAEDEAFEKKQSDL